MVRCSRCGKAIGNAKVCPQCGAMPSKSVVDKNVDRVARTTGRVVEKSILLTEDVVKEVKPVAKTLIRETKKGLSKAKTETLKIARSLKEEGT
jgi:hypothetical protein